jgi:hypothetical protein
MDNFDKQITLLKPTTFPAQLDERQFMKNLTEAKRVMRMRRLFMLTIGVAALAVIIGAFRRDILELITLTIRYFGELPSLLSEYAVAYGASISWPGMLATGLIATLAVVLMQARGDITASHSRRTYRYATALSVLALTLGVAGLFMSSGHASAQQDALKRRLNERGHLEVQVDGADYELNSKGAASDDSIRKQALIERLHTLDISKVYPDLKNARSSGIVAEARAINTEDDCIFYVERRLEPVLNKMTDGNSSCIRSEDQTRYLTADLQPSKAPKWMRGQTFYITSASKQNARNPTDGFVSIIVLLDGKADSYIAQVNNQKLVPKGQPGTGSQLCGINNEDQCPQIGSVDLFINREGGSASNERSESSAIVGTSYRPQTEGSEILFFGKITALTDKQLSVQTSSSRKLVINWPENVIEKFNQTNARNYETTSGPLQVAVGDSLQLFVAYNEGMDTEQLQLSDVYRMDVALKTTLPNPLEAKAYVKDTSITKY